YRLDFSFIVPRLGFQIAASVGQANVIFGERRPGRNGFEQIVELCVLDLLAKCAFLRKTVERLGHPPGEPLSFPDALQRLLGIIVYSGARTFSVVFPKSVKELTDVARSQIQSLCTR